ncbi:MAG: ABC transporter permease [Chloracidobacterium sp.]|nr:ABC transporter permease [Chloracidobacterium sp.]
MVVATTSFIENFKMAIDTLRSNKLRSFLTIIGVVIGVITVMLISSLISGIKVAVEKQVESFGTTSIFLYKMDIGIRTSSPSREERMRKPLTMEDAAALSNLSSLQAAVPYLNITNNFFGQKINVTGKNGKTSSSIQLQGTLPDAEKAPGEVLIDGRWFSPAENDSKTNVCVVGDSIRDAYFPNRSPIGETVEIGGSGIQDHRPFAEARTTFRRRRRQ